MTNAISPADRQVPAEIIELDSKARRFETPCPGGSMVWRAWGSGEPLVLVHGSHGCWTHWIRNIEALSQSRMVIAVDLPGHGDSVSPEEESHSAMAAALATGLKQILEQVQGPGSKADIAGFSFGGVISAYFAFYHPELVRRLILVGVGGLVGEERRKAMKANLLGLMLHHPDTVDDLAMHLLVANAGKARFSKIADLVVPDKLLAILPQIEIPIDAIWGEFDRPHPNPHLHETILRQFQPDMNFQIVPGAGHWAMYERPEIFNRILLNQLSIPIRILR